MKIQSAREAEVLFQIDKPRSRAQAVKVLIDFYSCQSSIPNLIAPLKVCCLPFQPDLRAHQLKSIARFFS